MAWQDQKMNANLTAKRMWDNVQQVHYQTLRIHMGKDTI